MLGVLRIGVLISVVAWGHVVFAATATATFAGGCFWCMQPPYDQLPGVISTVVGYTGGKKKNPTYKQISSGTTRHCEAVHVTYDPSKVNYSQLLDVFWRNVDPTTPNAQFVDVGPQSRTAIYYHSAEQRRAIETSKQALGRVVNWRIVASCVSS